MMTNESDIIEGLKRGDNNAYAFLYKKHYRALCVFADYYTNDSFISETIVGDVIFNIWQNKDVIDISSLRGYLLKAVKNRCVNHLEQQKRQMDLMDKLGKQVTEEQEYYENNKEYPLSSLIEKELDLKIIESMSAMPDLTQKIFKLSRFSNLKYSEIAEKTGVSVDTVKYHIKSALSKLRNDLKDYLIAILIFSYVFL